MAKPRERDTLREDEISNGDGLFSMFCAAGDAAEEPATDSDTDTDGSDESESKSGRHDGGPTAAGLSAAEAVLRGGATAAPSLNRLDGSAESWWKLQAFLAAEAEAEVQAFFSPRTLDFVRVMVVRHGMGDHNTYGGIGSLMGQDPELNECGRAQADLVGDYLRASGVFSPAALDLVVVSPFTRTLQTCGHLLGSAVGMKPDPDRPERAAKFGYSPRGLEKASSSSHRWGKLRTLVQPYCAERADILSHMGRGNRGSTADELTRSHPDLASAFDFGALKAYCEERRVGVKGADRKGKWWHHGPHSNETDHSFRRRCMDLRRWLGSLAGGGGSVRCSDGTSPPPSPRLLMVTHGGVMDEGFGYHPNAPNCGFRVFDVARDGALLRVATGERVEVGFPLCKPAFKVLSVVSRDDPGLSHTLFDTEVQVGSQVFRHSLRESELREFVHDKVVDGLESEDYIRLRLGNKFPDYIRWSPTDVSLHIQDYLEQLATAMGDDEFPESLACEIDHFLLGGLLSQRLGLESQPAPPSD